jgi:hypothetical protein
MHAFLSLACWLLKAAKRAANRLLVLMGGRMPVTLGTLPGGSPRISMAAASVDLKIDPGIYAMHTASKKEARSE